MKEIIFVRHAESVANRDGIWNGRADGPLSVEGKASLEMLGKRLEGHELNVVVSSPLFRARETAAAFSDAVDIDDRLAEIDLGRWEGRTFDEIKTEDGDYLSRAIDQATLPMGETGESLMQVAERAVPAVADIVDGLDDGQSAAVVTHGGLMQAILSRHLPSKGRRVHASPLNTSITRILWHQRHARLATFNDVGHLGPHPSLVSDHLERGDPVMALIRHGRTKANVESRWQGQGDWDLDARGVTQARSLGAWYGQRSVVYSSPLRRAMSTAQQVARDGIVAVEGLKELSMGQWEGLTFDEISERWPGVIETIYRDGVDLKRGATGESWGELTARFSAAVAGLGLATGEQTAVVAHGGAIRAYISSLTATRDTYSESLFTPANTSVTHVAVTQKGPVILDYSVATHLETLEDPD